MTIIVEKKNENEEINLVTSPVNKVQFITIWTFILNMLSRESSES